MRPRAASTASSDSSTPHRPFIVLASAAFLSVLLAPQQAQAQPSGGPYGPIHQRYEIPKGVAHVYYVAPNGKADAPGTTLAQPTTLARAIEQVLTGDAIILRGGTYRTGGLKLNQGITLQPYADELPVLKGTQVATQWKTLPGKLWRTSWPRLFPSKPQGWWQRDHEGKKTPLHRFNNDMVFVDGESLRSAGWEGEVDEHSFYIDYDTGQVFIGVDPTNRLVEITAWDSALVRTTADCHGKASDRKGPAIRGITFTQYAYRALEVEGKRNSVSANDEPTDDPVGPADPATYGKEVVGTTLENVTISHCSRVAGYFRGDKLTIRNSLISDTSTEGIYVIGSSDVLLEKNIFRRNNVEEITGYFPAAVKIFNQSYRVTCRDNLVIEQSHSNGIWYDVGNVDGVFVDNWVEDALSGFFFEISKGAICARNVFVNCEQGILLRNASNVRAYNNTLVNSPVLVDRTERVAAGDLFGWHASTGPDIDKRDGHVFVGNLLTADERYSGALLRFYQPGALCARLTRPQVTQLDGNVYVRGRGATAAPLIVWSPAAGEACQAELQSLDALRKLQPQFEAHGRYVESDLGSLFKSPELQRYELLRPLAGTATIELPTDVLQLLGWKKQDAHSAGAYQTRP